MPLVPRHIQELQSYKPGQNIAEIQRKLGLDKIIKLASNENPFGPSPLALEAVKQNLKENFRYPDAAAILLREKLAEKFDLTISNVTVGAGSEGVMSAIMRTFLRQGDEIIGAENSFIGFRVLANASGNRINWVPLKNYRHDLEAMTKCINEYTKLIYLANPDNPTGTYFTIDEFDEFMNRVPERVLIILDEAYFEYAQHLDDYPDSMHYRYDNVITLRSFSKAHGLAGFRAGYGFAHEDLIENLPSSAGCVLVTHDMPQARAWCNRAIVMLEGRIVEELSLPDGQPTHPYARMLFDPWGEHDFSQSTAT